MRNRPLLLPGRVFTPDVIAQGDIFQPRTESGFVGGLDLQTRLSSHLSPKSAGMQITVFGETGVGKSSLVMEVIRQMRLTRGRVLCTTGMSFEDIANSALADIRPEKISVTKRSRSGEFGLRGTKGAGSREMTFVRQESHVLQELHVALTSSRTQVLVIDNFQNIHDPQVRAEVAQALEYFHDKAGPKLIVIGISHDATQLLSVSESTRRRVIQLHVPRMSDGEIQRVYSHGFEALGLKVGANVLGQLVFLADGFPYYAHLIGLRLAVNAERERRLTVTEEDLRKALAQVSDQSGATDFASFQLASEVSGDVRPRRNILILLAKDRERREWRVPDVARLWELTQSQTHRNQRAIATSLRQLTQEKYGALLQVRRGGKGENVYSFSRPETRVFLRMHATMTSADWLM